jgi:hypothetical protein
LRIGAAKERAKMLQAVTREAEVNMVAIDIKVKRVERAFRTSMRLARRIN